MQIYDLISSRRSVRKYKKDAVDDGILQRIMEAARLAPSACNLQPWRFYVVRDSALRGAILDRQVWATAAPVMIIACAVPDEAWVRKDEKNHADIDVTIAFEHIILAATAEGMGTCWICSFDVDKAAAALELPAGVVPIAITPLGYPDETPEERGRKDMKDIVIWR